MDMDKSGRLNKFEFLTAMLIRLGKVERSELDEVMRVACRSCVGSLKQMLIRLQLMKQFGEMDVDRDGWITQDDLHLAAGIREGT